MYDKWIKHDKIIWYCCSGWKGHLTQGSGTIVFIQTESVSKNKCWKKTRDSSSITHLKIDLVVKLNRQVSSCQRQLVHCWNQNTVHCSISKMCEIRAIWGNNVLETILWRKITKCLKSFASFCRINSIYMISRGNCSPH